MVIQIGILPLVCACVYCTVVSSVAVIFACAVCILDVCTLSVHNFMS